MQSSNLVDSFTEIARKKDIERDTLQLIIEDVIGAMIQKRYGSDEAFEVIFNPDHGDIQVLHIREVVSDMDMEDPVNEIEIKNAVEIDPDFVVGDEVASEISIDEFGRRAVMTAQQTLQQRLRDIEKEHIYEKYSKLMGEIVAGEIHQIRPNKLLVMHDNVELVMPRSEQIRGERFRKGDMVRAVVKEVHRDRGKRSQVVISRTDEQLMERLFEIEVPEIHDGIVELKKIVREPGNRAKVTVVSHDERVDPVGACVGMKGVRIHAVVRELDNENIDVLPHADDPRDLISRALSPANPINVEIKDDLDPPRATVVVPEDEVSRAIGSGGINIRLASRLAEYEIDVYRDIAADEEDVEIEEFADALPMSIIDRLQEIGCDTAKAVMELSLDELERRTGFDGEVAEGVMIVIEAEFEEPEEFEGLEMAEIEEEEQVAPEGSGEEAETAPVQPEGETDVEEASTETEVTSEEEEPTGEDAAPVEDAEAPDRAQETAPAAATDEPDAEETTPASAEGGEPSSEEKAV
jgi:N utilization substance protein A